MRVIHHRGFPGFDLESHCRDLSGVELVGVDTPDEMAALAGTADAVMCNGAGYTEAVARACAQPDRRLRWIQFLSTGIETAERFGVPQRCVVTNASSVWAPAVAEHAVAMMLALKRGVQWLERDRLARRWDRKALLARLGTLDGAQVGILGFGGIGAAIAQRLAGFGVTIHGFARSDRAKPGADVMHAIGALCDVAPRLDILCSALPLTPATRHIVDAKVLACLKPHAYVVNVGRGLTMDEAALAHCLAEGRLAGAALDVFETEPLPETSPLWDMANVILSPHVAAYDGSAGWQRLGRLCRANILRFQAGEPLSDEVIIRSLA